LADGNQGRPKCSKCGVLLTDDNWYEFHRNPKPRYLSNVGKFYALRLSICKQCSRRRANEAGKRRRAEQNRVDPGRVYTRYTGLRLAWRGTFKRRMTSEEVLRISEQAESIAASVILPSEGFEDICWLHNHHAPIDVLAKRDNQTYAVDVTTATYKSYTKNSVGNKNAIEWLIRNTSLQPLILFVSPDLTRYLMKPLPKGKVWASIQRDDLKFAKSISSLAPSPNLEGRDGVGSTVERIEIPPGDVSTP
jgi:hypothetical protein